MTIDISLLEKKLGYLFNDPTLLKTALRHRSAGGVSNERLEFLGDAVLNFVVAAELFKRYPMFREGDLSRLRANLVKGDALALLAQDFDIGEFLFLGAGEKKSGGYRRSSILADAMEAIIGAIYLDSNFERCSARIIAWYGARLEGLTPAGQKDAKSELQEYLQAHKLPLPQYQVVAAKGKAHDQMFYVECRVEGLDFVTEGAGHSRQRAEKDAANKFLKLVQ